MGLVGFCLTSLADIVSVEGDELPTTPRDALSILGAHGVLEIVAAAAGESRATQFFPLAWDPRGVAVRRPAGGLASVVLVS